MATRVEIEFLHFITRPFCCIVISRNEVTSNRSLPTWNPNEDESVNREKEVWNKGWELAILVAIQAFGGSGTRKTMFAAAKQWHFDSECAPWVGFYQGLHADTNGLSKLNIKQSPLTHTHTHTLLSHLTTERKGPPSPYPVCRSQRLTWSISPSLRTRLVAMQR